MKKLVVLLLVALMTLGTTAMVFAEETTTEKGERQERSKEDKREGVLELFSTYFAEGLDDFNAAITAHKSFHESVRSEREIFKADQKAAREAYRESIKSGDYTREEAKAIFEEAKAANLALKAELEAIRTLKKADVAANDLEMKTVREALRAALQEEVIDGALVQSYLGQMTVLMNEHLDIDTLYYDMIQALVNP